MPSLGQRPYSQCRAAFIPRLWPMALVAALISFPLTYALVGVPWLIPISAFVLAFGLVQARWTIWRWRHPKGQCTLCKLGRDLDHVARQREMAPWQ